VSNIADALSSASLLLAALALVYGAWSGEIEKQASRAYSPNVATKTDQKAETRGVRDKKALPLMLGSWLIFLAFLPRALDIAGIALGCTKSGGCHYEDVSAVFILTQVFVLGLAAHLTGRWFKLNSKLGE
jgi:hypothetical protein